MRRERVKVPMLVVFRDHPRTLVLGTLISLTTFVVFYLMTVFTLSWGTTALGFSRDQFLLMQLGGVIAFGVTIPIAAILAERGRRRTLMGVTVGVVAFGLVMAPLFEAGAAGALLTMIVGLSLMGLSLGPARHGVVGALSDDRPLHGRPRSPSTWQASSAPRWRPYIATWLANTYGLQYVGFYLSAAALLTLVGLLGDARDEGRTSVAAPAEAGPYARRRLS